MSSDRQTMRSSVVVTGVSTGIGNGILRQLLGAGLRVFGSVRRPQDAERLAAELGGMFVPVLFDVTDTAAVRRGAEEVRERLAGEKLAGLVNNAGVAVPGPLLEMPLQDFRRQIEVNLVSVLGVTQAFFPLLRTRADGERPARIITISSVAGQFALPFLGPYAASKHGVEGLSDSLRRECLLNGVEVVVIDPGSVATPIWAKAEQVDLSRYGGSIWLPAMTKMRDAMVTTGRRGMPPERIGGLVVRILQSRRPRPRYVVGSGRFMVWMVRHLLGARFADWVIARALGLRATR